MAQSHFTVDHDSQPDVQDLLENTHTLRTDSERALEASRELIGQTEPTAAAFVQSECRMLIRGLHQFEQAVKRKLGEVQVRGVK